MLSPELTEMEPLFSINKNVRYLLCVIDVYTKCALVEPLKVKKIKLFLIHISK